MNVEQYKPPTIEAILRSNFDSTRLGDLNIHKRKDSRGIADGRNAANYVNNSMRLKRRTYLHIHDGISGCGTSEIRPTEGKLRGKKIFEVGADEGNPRS